MRIQHNIMAMNAYRNYNNNTSALSKNLEKLSSGYKINRAGDDAAGLAISEKMRAQITGLKAASKNVKDGVSLVKTAEGALQEVHDMLNRMDYLATQSANGTYDNEVDRANLQKEVKSLKDEIDRISESANFNGKKLLNGELAGGPSASVPEITNLTMTDVAGVKGKQTAQLTDAGAGGSALTDGAVLTTTINYTDANGNSQTAKLELTFDKAKQSLVTKGGEKIALTANTHATKAEMAKALAAAAKEDAGLSAAFKVGEGTTGNMTFDSKVANGNVKINSVVADYDATGANKAASLINPAAGAATAADPFQKLAAADAVVYDGTNKEDAVFTVGGEKFAFANTQDQVDALGKEGIHAVKLANANTVQNADLTNMASEIKQYTGYAPTVNTTDLEFKAPANANGEGGGLKLQIGDTNADYEQLEVKIGKMSSTALGIGALDISTQDGAANAIQKIKDAINTVSSTRGDLGAIQNRLEHTQNNLSVMTENIQDAESTIRDTDVADEMMAYTKNNILIQSAQAMLAQANQVPQGVLQLLQ